MHYQTKSKPVAYLLLIMAVLTGCKQEGPAALPPRKKMPEFTNEQSFEGRQQETDQLRKSSSGNFVFSTTNSDLSIEGTSHKFLTIALPDTSNDLMAITLLTSFKPFALPLISSWSKQDKRGILIDLSRHDGNEIYRTDYRLERENDFSIPVVIMWDHSSSARETILREMANEIPETSFNQISGTGQTVNSTLITSIHF